VTSDSRDHCIQVALLGWYSNVWYKTFAEVTKFANINLTITTSVREVIPSMDPSTLNRSDAYMAL